MIISKIKVVKIQNEDSSDYVKMEDSMLMTMNQIFKVLAEQSLKCRQGVTIPFRMNELMDYLRDSLTQLSQVVLVGCINNDYQETIRYDSVALIL